MRRGFTIIEMLVSVGIFLVLVVLGMTAVLGMINANRKSQSSTLALSNLGLAIEAISKDIRVGTDFTIYGNGIQFKRPSENKTIRYTYDTGDKTIVRETVPVTGTSYISDITAPEIEIEDLRFYITENIPGCTPPGCVQPSVMVLIKAKAQSKAGTETEFYLQSMVSQRATPTL